MSTRPRIFEKLSHALAASLAGLMALVCALLLGPPAHGVAEPVAPRQGTATPGCSQGWNIVPSPNSGFQGNRLYEVAVITPDDVWAVGNYRNADGMEQTLTLHWDGAQWSIIPSPNIGSARNYLFGVDGVAGNDVWAVGEWQDGTGQYQTLILRWNGSAWSVSPSPSPGDGGNYLTAVTVIAPNDAWAVGYWRNGNIAPHQTLFLHWDGSAWTQVPGPSVSMADSQLMSVAGTSSSDVWAVGISSDGSRIQSLVEHWNGTEWSLVPVPLLGTSTNFLRDVDATSPNDAWAVGYYYNGSTFPTLTLRWNGVEWSVVPSANVGSSNHSLDGVVALAADDVWAVGSYGQGLESYTLAMHWNGSQWSVVASPNVQTGNNFLTAVDASSSNELWAAGRYFENHIAYTLVQRYIDACVTPTTTPQPSRTATPTMTGLVSATSASTVAPSATLTATATATATTAASPTSTMCAIQFADVRSNHTFYANIRCLACRGIVSGYADGTFKPDNLVTRSQLAKIVSNAGSFTEDPGPQIFQDVPTGHAFYEWINRLTNRGYMSGYTCGSPGEPCVNNRPYFRPFANATRAQTSKIVSNAAMIETNIPPDQQTFEDVPSSHPFWIWIERLAARGVMGGYNCGGPVEPCSPQRRAYFRPYNDVTRGQSAKIVANTFFLDCRTP